MAGKPLTVDEIRNRVVEVRKVRFGDVANHPRNPKKHPDNQRAAFRGAVREIGFASVPVAYVNGQGVLTWADGHLRGSEAADYVGDVAILDITDTEADLLLVTADPIAALAQTDAAALDALLQSVNTGDEALQQMLADMAEGVTLPDGDEWAGAFGGLPDSDRAPFQQMTFTLHDTQAEQVKQAIAIAGEMGDFVGSPNQNSNGNALSFICETFITEHGR